MSHKLRAAAGATRARFAIDHQPFYSPPTRRGPVGDGNSERPTTLSVHREKNGFCDYGHTAVPALIPRLVLESASRVRTGGAIQAAAALHSLVREDVR